MSLYSQLQNAKSEEDVKDAYIKALGLKGYTKGLIDDLEYFGFPMPHEQKPIEKSGFMLCVWHVDRDSVRDVQHASDSPRPHTCFRDQDLHHIIQDGFMKAKAEAHLLLDRGM